MKRLSLRVRLTALFVVIYGSTTILFSLFAYYKLNESLLHDFDNALYNYSIDISQTIEYGPSIDLNLPQLIMEEGKIFPFPSGTALILVRHISGEILSRSGNFGLFLPPFQTEVKKILKGADSAYVTINDTDVIPEAEANTYRVITFPLDSETNPTLFLQIAAPRVTLETQTRQLKNILQFGLPAVLAVAILAGLFFASRALRPVQEMIQFTNRLRAEDLHERIPLPGTRDEIRKLAETLNEMLERIEKAFTSQERFVADASHQLLTPLTILKGEIETNARSTQDEAQQKVYKSLLQEVDNLSRIVKDMLLLARIDAGESALQFSEIYLDEILIDVISRLQRLAKTKNIQISFDLLNQEQRAPILGDADLLINLVMNLIENSIKYSPEGQAILVKLDWEKSANKLTVEDFGQGIPESLRAQVFNRFSRADTSSNTKGFGLGLAIAQKIALLHKSEIQFVEKPAPGTLVELKFQNK
ncbi:sensor histidine kinase [Pseudobdellovibrio sp. HCB154]|uniref:sensor histidine kinase n=1 Tax=Pseudobdellovibrio sp. HCB154 TaxID=3386277 RepID=UPI003917347A